VSYETILLEKSGFAATITFNRPKVFNAYSEQMSQELKAAVDEVARDEAVR
jgi:enoyl-CoA hydratase/carnithine racemase